MTTKNNVIATQDNNAVSVIGPDRFIEQAISSNASVETLEKLMVLKERHESNEARKAFFRAMQEFQEVKPNLTRSQSVSFGNGKTSYNFCPLSDIEKALKEPLSECGLSYRFETGMSETMFSVTCIVSHVMGHSERTTMSAPADESGNKNKIQGIGSTSTYLMRYTLIAAFALTSADEDNDGETNSDLPFQRVLVQNDYLKNPDTLEAVAMAKRALSENDYYTVCDVIYSMPEEQINALWLAPTKGGVFTTLEIKQMKSDEFSQTRLDWHAKKEE